MGSILLMAILTTAATQYLADDFSGGNGVVVPSAHAAPAKDRTKPVILVAAPDNGGLVVPQNGNVVISGAASDAGSGIGAVHIRLDKQSYIPVVPASTNDWSTWSATYSSIAAGAHTFTVRATDKAGNQEWDTVRVTVGEDTTDPLVAITAPLDGDTVVLSSAGKLTVKGKASDAGSGIGAVHIRLDEQSYIPVVPASTNDWSTWSATYSSIAAGAHTFTVRATDKAGNQEWDIATVSIRTDTIQPIVTITTPPDDASLPIADVEVTGIVTDNSEVPSMAYSLDGGQFTAAPVSTESFAFTLTGLEAGSHTLTVRAEDSAGNSFSDSVSFTINNYEPVPEASDQYPIPTGFTRVGEFSDGSDWEFWGRYTTNYASGGSGPSQRWDNEKMNKLNMVAGYDFRIGPTSGSRNTSDMVDLKFPRCVSDGGERGSYDLGIRWYDSGANSIGQAGKEMPHPATRIDDFNKNDPRPQIGNIKDGAWHSMLSVIYNDPLNGNAVTMKTWYNPTASGKIEDYIYLGSSVDSGNMPSGGEGGERILRYDCDPTTGGTHPLQIRIDEIPQGSLYVRNMFAAEVVPPR